MAALAGATFATMIFLSLLLAVVQREKYGATGAPKLQRLLLNRKGIGRRSGEAAHSVGGEEKHFTRGKAHADIVVHERPFR